MDIRSVGTGIIVNKTSTKSINVHSHIFFGISTSTSTVSDSPSSIPTLQTTLHATKQSTFRKMIHQMNRKAKVKDLKAGAKSRQDERKRRGLFELMGRTVHSGG